MYDLLGDERVELKVRDFDVIVPHYNNKTSKTTAAQVSIIKQDCLHACKDSSDMIKWMLKGYSNRTKTAHSMNDFSSRSHCLFSILVKQEFKKEQKVINSKINICDLAGSERIKKTNVSGVQLAEAISTNTSLSVLNSCIRSLTDKSATYIPYRHSRLTWLLQDTLGGTAKTVVLGTISPSASEYSETLLTLNYIKLAKQMTPSKLEAESLLKEVVVEQASMTKSRSVALRLFRKVGYAAIWIYRVKKRSKTYHCFLTHNWGKRQEDGTYDNHERVRRIYHGLQSMNVSCWFDSDRLHGTISEQMSKGIDDSSCVIGIALLLLSLLLS